MPPTRLLFDLETDGLLGELTCIHSLVLQNVDTGVVTSCANQPGYTSIEDGVRLLLGADEIIGHNIICFDIPALRKMYPWFDLQDDVLREEGVSRKVTDTLTLSRLIWTDLKDRDFTLRRKRPDFPGNLIGRHSLEAWGHRLDLHKGDYAKEMKAEGKDPWASWNPSMQTYCEQDVAVTARFLKLIESKKYSPKAIDLEHDFQHIIFRQEQFGFPFDVTAGRTLYTQLVKRRIELEKELLQVFPPFYQGGKTKIVGANRVQRKGQIAPIHWEKGDAWTPITLTTFNPGSREHIALSLTRRYGWKPQEFGADGKPTMDESVLSKLPYPETKLLLEYLLVQKRIGQLGEGNQACLKLVALDGRIHGRVTTNGAVTGRCTHSHPNVAQTPRVGSPYGKEFRALYHAPIGYRLVGADASGLELRCLAHYMANFDGGAYAKVILEGDIHTVNQQAAGLPTRANAKTFIYAFLYGAGDEKIGEIIGKGAGAGARIKKAFLQQTPALKRLREVVAHKVKEQGNLKGLDGRLLHIRSPHAALNTLLQSAGALVVKKATILLYRKLHRMGMEWGKDWAMVAHVHDEFQLMVREGLEQDIGNVAIESFREAGEFFNFRCQLTGEFRAGNTWADTH